MWAILVKEFRQLRRDRRTVAMLLMLPFLFLIIFGYAASFDVKNVKAVVVGPLAAPVAALLPDRIDVVGTYPDEDEAFARDALRDGDAVVAIVTPSSPAELVPPAGASAGGTPATSGARVLVDGSELFAARAAVTMFAQNGGQAPVTSGGSPVALPTPEILYNPDLKTSVIMVPGLCGIILVFVGTVATALGVVRERQAGTLEQLAVMPFRPADVFVGKIGPYLLIAAVDMVVIVLVGILLFGVPFAGSIATFALGAALFLFVTLGIGVLVSTVSQTQGQAIQLAMMTMLPQFLLSGLFFPLYSMPWGVRWIGYCLPLTWFVKVARGVMVRGTPIGALWLPLVVLAAMAAVVFTLSVLRFRRDLAPAPQAGDGSDGLDGDGGRAGTATARAAA
jgi:ABC-2 type transport system permease protein